VLSSDARALLRTAVRSVWALEALKCLRTEPIHHWTVDALRVELRASELAIQQAVSGFRAAGLVADEEGGIRYRPATPQIDALVGEIGREYERRPIALVKEIYVPETSSIQDFADAFRFKKDDS
jgi:hypothetical protein